MPKNADHFGPNARRRASEQNISVSELARRTGLNRSSLHRILSGEKPGLKLATAITIAEALKSTVDSLSKETP